jgi:hypothetical protein
MFLSTDNEACLAWLADALRRPRPEGRTKTVGYLEAVLEEVVFEAKMNPRPLPFSASFKVPSLPAARRRQSEDGAQRRRLETEPHYELAGRGPTRLRPSLCAYPHGQIVVALATLSRGAAL